MQKSPNLFQQEGVPVEKTCTSVPVSKRTTVQKIENTAKNIPGGFGVRIVSETVGEFFCLDQACPVHGDQVREIIKHCKDVSNKST
jgi:hypothetical protein